MKVYLVETSPMAPYQFSGITELGDYVYIRHRGDRLTVLIASSLSSEPNTILAIKQELTPDFEELTEILHSQLNWEPIHLGIGWDEILAKDDPYIALLKTETGYKPIHVVESQMEIESIRSIYKEIIALKKSELLNALSFVGKEY